LLAFVVIFALCSCCSLMVVAPTNLVALNLGSKLQEDLENPHTLSTLPTYNCFACYHYAYCMAPPSLCDQRIRIISLSL
jgi:hypothetical protein